VSRLTSACILRIVPEESATGPLERRLETVLPWAAGLLLAAPVLVAYYPPMTDLPFHEAAIGLLRHRADSAMVPPGLYVLNLGKANQLFHMLGWLLSYVVSTRWAVKLLVAATIVALPVGAGRFARHLGASPLASLVVAPLGVGWLFSCGFITNLVGLAALLFALPVADRLAANPTPRRALAGLAAVLLLYFAHLAMLIAFAGVALGLALVRPWSWRRTPWTLSAFGAGCAAVLVHVLVTAHLETPMLSIVPLRFDPLLRKLQSVPAMILRTTALPRFSVFALCVVAIGSFFWLRARERRGSAEASVTDGTALSRWRARALAIRWELVALAGFAAYLAFPVTMRNGAMLVYQRWFQPAFAIAAVVAAPRDLWKPRARIALMAALAVPVATVLTAWPTFADSDQAYRDLESLVVQIEPGSAVAKLDFLPGDVPRNYLLINAYGRVMAERGGRLFYAFTDSPISPMVLRRRYQWNESLVRINVDSWWFMPRHDLRLYEYVVLRTRDPFLASLVTIALADEAEPIAEAGEWVLYRSKLPVVPLESREPAMESPAPDTIGDRIGALRRAMGQRPMGDSPYP
jgi:hypothetical protein